MPVVVDLLSYFQDDISGLLRCIHGQHPTSVIEIKAWCAQCDRNVWSLAHCERLLAGASRDGAPSIRYTMPSVELPNSVGHFGGVLYCDYAYARHPMYYA